ncbi:MAG: hypothetical protein ACOYL8_04120 [Patescibacteria group bacterium]
MQEENSIKKILPYLSIFLIIEILSYFSLSFLFLNQVIFIVLAIYCLIISFYRLEYGLLLVLGELLIGSMGHLFVLSVGDFQLSIRMVFWLIIMLVFSLKFIKQLFNVGKNSNYLISLKNFSYLKYVVILFVFVVISLLNAYFRGHNLNLIFSDANSWLYWFLILPLVVVYSKNDKKLFVNLKVLFIAACLWISLKTLALLFVFTHNLDMAPNIYTWLRKTLVGEMTPTLSGWPRIFIQGQIFSGLALFLTFWSSLKIKKKEYLKVFTNICLATIFASSLLISFSRSFWVGLIVAIIFSFVTAWRIFSWKKALNTLVWFFGSFVFGFIVIYLVAIFPYPTPGKFNADFINRISNGGESAVSSRWSLLPILGKEIMKEPFFGQGYGATATYISSDPRVLEKNPSGEYTTYAFEWGFFDLWLKLGLFGLFTYLLLLYNLLKNSITFAYQDKNFLLFGLASGIVFLIATNFFTPYLNHPLGIGILLFGACLIQKDRVY